MDSINDIDKLERVPTDDKYSELSFSDTIKAIEGRKSADVSIEASLASEAVMISLFEARNIPDSLSEAYSASFTNSDISLYEHYSSILDKGDASVGGFVSNLKGKVFEIELTDKLESIYPDFDFSIATDPTNPIWDIKGVNVHDGTEFLIQAKMGASQYATDVIERMQDNPNVLFAVSSEIHDKIVSAMPNLADQFINVDVSNYEFTNDVNANLNLLVENMGIDVPDGIGELLPYVGEIVLGIRLILDLISVQRDFKAISFNDKAKLSAVKCVVLLSRFGVSTICTSIGGAAGTAAGSVFPGPGNLVGGISGSIAGAITASKLNKFFKPNIMEFAFGLTGLDENDMFYFHNKKRIDGLAFSFTQMQC
jgi:hypothetical protein